MLIRDKKFHEKNSLYRMAPQCYCHRMSGMHEKLVEKTAYYMPFSLYRICILLVRMRKYSSFIRYSIVNGYAVGRTLAGLMGRTWSTVYVTGYRYKV